MMRTARTHMYQSDAFSSTDMAEFCEAVDRAVFNVPPACSVCFMFCVPDRPSSLLSDGGIDRIHAEMLRATGYIQAMLPTKNSTGKSLDLKSAVFG